MRDTLIGLRTCRRCHRLFMSEGENEYLCGGCRPIAPPPPIDLFEQWS